MREVDARIRVAFLLSDLRVGRSLMKNGVPLSSSGPTESSRLQLQLFLFHVYKVFFAFLLRLKVKHLRPKLSRLCG